MNKHPKINFLFTLILAVSLVSSCSSKTDELSLTESCAKLDGIAKIST